MLRLHPSFMFAATLLGVYVFLPGAGRFLDKRRGGKPTFRWKRHVTLGLVTLFAWLAGMFFGVVMIYLNWKPVLLPGWLPRVYGLAGLVVLVLALSQIVTGWSFHIEPIGGS